MAPFPSMDRRYVISTQGGRSPRWSGDGRQPFFLTADGIDVVDVGGDTELRVSRPRSLFTMSSVGNFDVAPDGERFIVIQDNIDALPKDVHVVLNWSEELKRRVPTDD